MDRKLDNGPILVQQRIPVAAGDTLHSCIGRLRGRAAALLAALDLLEAGEEKRLPNAAENATYFVIRNRGHAQPQTTGETAVLSKPAQKIALPHAAIVVVTYNSADHIAALAASLRADEPAGYRRELIFVDNASTDDTTARLRTALPEAVVLINEANLGFGAANNGARPSRARGPSSSPFSIPTRRSNGWLEPLLHALRADPDLGAVQPRCGRARSAAGRQGGNVVTSSASATWADTAGVRTGWKRICAAAPMPAAHVWHAHEEFLAAEDSTSRFSCMSRIRIWLGLRWWARKRPRRPRRACGTITSFTRRGEILLARTQPMDFLATHFQARTLALLLPALLIVELGLWAYFLYTGMAAAKWRAMRDFFRPDIAAWRRAKRATLQRERRLSDHELASWLTAEIELPGGDPAGARGAHPFLRAYGTLIKRFI
jgi:hypothetical protein